MLIEQQLFRNFAYFVHIINPKYIVLSHFSSVWVFVTPWTVAHQTLLSMGFSQKEYWSGLPFLPLPDLPNPGIKSESLLSLALPGMFFATITSQETLKYIINSVAQSCPTLCNPMNRSTSGLPVNHQLQEFTQTHVHRVGDAIQPSHPLPSPSPPALNLSQHQSLFQWVNSSHEVAKVLEFQL